MAKCENRMNINTNIPKVDNIIKSILKYKKHANVDSINKAYNMCINAHQHQERASGEPYATHPIAVAQMVADMKFDEVTIITALLHDIVEDTDITTQDIEKEFSPKIATLVDGITKLDKIKLQTRQAKQSENFRKLFLALSKDIRVIIVKFCDRIHNMQTIEFQPKHKQHNIAIETLEIYAPLAEQLGMQTICDQLQDLSFKTLNPTARLSIIEQLSNLKQKYSNEIKTDNILLAIQNLLHNLLSENGVKNIKVIGREKTSYSIWNKIIGKRVVFEELCDVMAFRIITKSIDKCYKALGVIHKTYHAVPETFTDYLSTPKHNGYQSIHTAILGPFNHKIEIQIRTQDMHTQAEYGLAAHWQYKQSAPKQNETIIEEQHSRIWINKVLDITQDTNTAEEFLEATKLEMYQEQLFAFTTKGEIVSLPNNATVLDFAFAAGKNTGLKCYNGEISGITVPIEHKIKNGDKIRIITKNTVTPQPHWLEKCITARAKTLIKYHINNDINKQIRDKGRNLLCDILHQKHIQHNQHNLNVLIQRTAQKDLSSLYIAIGKKEINIEPILIDEFTKSKLSTSKEDHAIELKVKNNIITPQSQHITEPKTKKNKIYIRTKASLNIAATLSTCCNPQKTDKICGLIVPNQIIFIHKQNCNAIKNIATNHNPPFNLLWNQVSQ